MSKPTRSSQGGKKGQAPKAPLEVLPIDEPTQPVQPVVYPGMPQQPFPVLGTGYPMPGMPATPMGMGVPGPMPVQPYPAYPAYPAQAYPAGPMPMQPGYVGPMPVQPGPMAAFPMQPMPLGPMPVGPMPVQPMPFGPMPAQVVPMGPLPVQPMPVGPTPVPVAPASPIPVESSPVAPSPAQAAPAKPVKPTPARPATTTPVEAKQSTPKSKSKISPETSLPPSEPKPVAAASPSARPILVTDEQKESQTSITAERGWQMGRKPVGVKEELEQLEQLGGWTIFWQNMLAHHRPMLVSLTIHALALLILALWVLPGKLPELNLFATMADPVEPEMADQLEEIKLDNPDVGNPAPDIVDRPSPESLQPKIDMKNAAEGVDAGSVQLSDFGLEKAPFNDVIVELGRGTGLANQIGTGKGKKGHGFGLNGDGMGLGGRGGRRGQAGKFGATPESESAVDSALKWLADHQLPDGGWSFNHGMAPTCQNKCSSPGDMPEARIAATAFGVLPFLGAGQTHQVGKFQKTVSGGLYFLINHMKMTKEGGSLMEPGGRMYAHGLATIALCEAYAMNMNPEALRKKKRAAYDGEGAPTYKDKQEEHAVEAAGGDLANKLGPAAQLALNYIMYAQDPNGGGWRYEPRTPGDTSVVGWQLMALVSGKLAYLRVDPRCFALASTYLDHVRIDPYGSDYGYTDPQRGTQATRAIGLLSRMYLGWRRDNPGLQQGIDGLSGWGPISGNMYYNYYATQVLHHFGGEKWKQWNDVMRDSLVNSQSHNGHEAGSWSFGGGDMGASKGGRLYCTAMAAMTLEVYYRHLPIYGESVFEPPKPDPDAPKPEPDP
jgi:hypothetical protein